MNLPSEQRTSSLLLTKIIINTHIGRLADNFRPEENSHERDPIIRVYFHLVMETYGNTL